VSPLVHNASARIQAELMVRLWQVTGKSGYAKAARETIHSRPNWPFRKDYRQWIDEIEKSEGEKDDRSVDAKG
jgi:hypothetical protein